MEFNKKKLAEIKKLSIQEINQYYRELRKYEFEAGKELNCIDIRKKIHKLLILIIKIDRILKKENIILIGDKRIDNSKPTIYAATHIGGNEAERIVEIVKDHMYIMVGDPGIIYVNEVGLLLKANGWIPIDTRDKTDRHIAYERSVEVLNKGANLLIFPEGAYNVTENLPVMGIFPGAVKMSLETGCSVVPIAIEQYENDFFVNIGENMTFKQENSLRDEKSRLRDALATLKWEIWERQRMSSSRNFDQNYRDNFRQSIVDRDDWGDYVYTLDDIYETMYHDKEITTKEEAFSYLKNLK